MARVAGYIMKNNRKRVVILTLAILTVFFSAILLFFIRKIPVAYIWVMDAGEEINETHLIKMCPNGTKIVEVQFGQSGAIGIDPQHNSIWAPELNDKKWVNFNQVVKVDSDGNIIKRFQGYRTSVIGVDPNDGSVWVGLPNEQQLVKIDSNGNPILKVNGFPGPASIAVDPRDSSIWVADYSSKSLTHLRTDGVELSRTESMYFFSNASHQVAVDTLNDGVWYTGGFGSVYKLSPYGQLLIDVSGLDRPISISISQNDGSVWVADYSVSKSGGVVKLNANGNQVLRIILDYPPRLIGINPVDETIWAGINGAMIKLSKDGEILEIVTGFTKPQSIAFAKVEDKIVTKLKFISTCYGHH